MEQTRKKQEVDEERDGGTEKWDKQKKRKIMKGE